MEKLIKDYENIMNSSDELHDTAEDVLQDAANEEKSIKEEIHAFKDVFENDGIEGLKKKLSADSDKWKKTVLHIAVTGSSGAGKSAFINAIRDICADDDGGAEVGVTETTTALTSYKHPKNPNFIVWDMPGVGTPKYPKDKYIDSVKFDRYDFFMILSKSRFTENDLWLAKQIQQRNKKFYFIRTNIDIDIYNDSRARRKSNSAQDIMTKVRRDCHSNLIDAGIEAPLVFLVDNHDRIKYEFGNLENQLLQDSDSLKVEAIALSLTALTHDILKKKKEVLGARIEKKAFEIACLLDDEYEQKSIFDQELAVYKEQFNLDEQTLSTNKDILSLSDENLKEFKTFFRELSVETATKLCSRLLSLFGRPSSFIRLFRRIIMIYESALRNSFLPAHSQSVLIFSCFALSHNLHEVYETALRVYGFHTQKGLVKFSMQLGNN